ncbi:MAG: endonuclease domain-containing protein [Bacteroidetes bacterium]|nr:MAG: endonuclease domain-containing protein [Bacteroidota bacterium]
MSVFVSYELNKIAQSLARDMRNNPTEAEKVFWEAIRSRKVLGLRFLRQHPLFFDYLGKTTFYIADFYCREKRIVIEIDGRIHDYTKERDKQRTEIINLMGLRVFRFKNEEVLNNLPGTIEKLEKILSANFE